MPAKAVVYDQKKLSEKLFLSLQRRYRLQKAIRSPLNSLWDEIDYYTGPVKEQGSTAQNPSGGTGQNLESRRDLWDFTAIDGREKLSSSIYGTACGSSYRWMSFGAQNPEVARDNEVGSWLSDETEGVWNDIQASDFNTEMPAAIGENCGIGNSFIGLEQIEGEFEEVSKTDPRTRKKSKEIKETWEGVDFTCFPCRECYFEPDRKGNVKTFWRRLLWYPSQIIDHCEEKNIPVPEHITEKADKSSDTRLEVVFCYFERPEILKKKKVTYPCVPELRPYGYVWWIEDTKEQLGDEGGYYERSIFRGLWAKTAGSKWGHGLGNIALPTAKYVNAWKERLRAGGEKVLDPALLTEERNILSDVDYKAGGVTVVRKLDGIKPLESAAKFDVGEGMLEKDQKQLRDIFHTDDLQLKDSPAMTATEAQIRYEWMMRLHAKMLTYLQTYQLSPICFTILQMRIRTGAAKPMPKKLKDAGGEMNIEYQGPLARSQRTDEVAAIERGMSFLAGLAQFYPEIRAAADPLQAVKFVFQRLGVPANILPPDEVIRKGMKDILDSMQQQQQANTDQTNADANHKNAAAHEKLGGKGRSLGGSMHNSRPLGGTLGPVQYPGLPPKPALAPSGAPAPGVR